MRKTIISNSNYEDDHYSILEFQGTLIDTPEYDRKSGELRFSALSFGNPPLAFVSRGEVAKAFKCILTYGSVIQAKARPERHLQTVNGKSFTTVRWVAYEIHSLGKLKVDLSHYQNKGILDGLMPSSELGDMDLKGVD